MAELFAATTLDQRFLTRQGKVLQQTQLAIIGRPLSRGQAVNAHPFLTVVAESEVLSAY